MSETGKCLRVEAERQGLNRGLSLRRVFSIALTIAITAGGFAFEAMGATLSMFADTGSQDPYNIAIDQSNGGIYVVTQAGSANVGVSKVEYGSVATVYGNTGLPYTNGLAAGGGYLYLGNANSGPWGDSQIFRAPESGSGPIAAIYTGSSVGQPLFDISDLSYDAGRIYGADYAYGKIVGFNADGSSPQNLATRSSWSGSYEHFVSITLGNGTIYEGDNSGIYSVPSTGGSLTLAAAGNFGDIAFLNNTIYAIGGDADSLWQIPGSGGPATLLLGGDQFGTLNSLAAFDGKLYLTDSGLNRIWQVDPNASSVPEPTTMALLGSGLVGLSAMRKKFKK